MKFLQAQFSLKFEPQVKIRRSVNIIEDKLQTYYGVPQVVPIPDEIAAEAPRIILTSHNGHSQISFSQISADLHVNFDGEFWEKYESTKAYIYERVQLLKKVLEEIGINEYNYFGITYIMQIDIGKLTPIDYVKNKMQGIFDLSDNLYEFNQRMALVEEEHFFVNRQLSTFKQFQSVSNIPNLLDFKNSKIIAEGVSLSLDVNNRFSYMKNGNAPMSKFDLELDKIFALIEKNKKE